MAESITLTGMVLTSMPVGDYDKRITILTKERGKITAFARGSRKPQSQLLAATNPFSFGVFELYEGRSAYTLVKANISNYFRQLAMSFEEAYMGFYFMEYAQYYCQENNDEKEMLKLLYQSLRALESGKYNLRFVKAVFEMKAVVINGEGPQVFECVHCHKKEGLAVFSVKGGGMFCSKCGHQRGEQAGIRILDSTRYTLQYIASTSIEKLYSFTVSKEVLEELSMISAKYTKYYVHHTFNSLQVLEDSLEIKK